MASSDSPASQSSGIPFRGNPFPAGRETGKSGGPVPQAPAPFRCPSDWPPGRPRRFSASPGRAAGRKRRRAGRLGRSLRPPRGSLRHGLRDAHRGAQDPDCREVFRSFRGRGNTPSPGSRNRPGETALRIRFLFSPSRRSVPFTGFRSAAFVLLPDRSGHPPFPFRRVP